MAKKKENDLMMDIKLNKQIAQRVQDNIDNLYKSNMYTGNHEKQYLDTIKNMMNNNLNGLIDKSHLRAGETNMSDLYARTISNGDQNLSVMKEITDSSMLSDILDLYSNNMIVRDLDREIDVVLKYVPRLKQAQKLMKQAVLSSEHMDKESTKITVFNAIRDTEDANDAEQSETNEDKVKVCKKKYDWKKLEEELYDKTSTYGEQFVYILPYKKALERVMKSKENHGNIVTESTYLSEAELMESIEDDLSTIHLAYITESTDEKVLGQMYDLEEIPDTLKTKLTNSEHMTVESLDIEINTSGTIPSIVNQACTLRRVLHETLAPIHEATLKMDYGMVKDSKFLKDIDKEFKKFAKDSLKAPTDMMPDDGFNPTNAGKRKGQTAIEVPGCIVQLLKHEYVKPLYIEKVCLGYYYIESDRPLDYDAQTTFSSTLGGLRPRRSTRDRENMDKTYMDNAVLRKIAKQISLKIDRKFINANQDLAEEIYTILKYNSEHNDGKVSKLRISFIPPEDIVHSYFNMNMDTHRGKSDFELSLFPAKLYSCLYISNVIAILTRGYDKRVYHVRQTVDTNIKGVLLNVINQIKLGNYNLRQIENMNNITNITGRFNDLVIPQNANGESPVNMEVLPGQNIDIKSEFMRNLEEMAIELMDVSMEMISANFDSAQTATNIVQNNERMLITVYKRQELYSQILAQIFTKIYQAEYGLNDILEVELPTPSQLKLNNISQIISVANDVVQNIVQMLASADDDFKKQIFTGKLMEYYIGPFFDMKKIMDLYDEAQIDASIKPNPMDQQMGGSMPGGGMGGSNY